MKYQRPAQGPYESGLTAKLLYDNVSSLIKPLPTSEEIRVMIEEGKLVAENKLWNTPERRPEIEEFNISFLFDDLQAALPDDLQPPLPGFEEIFKIIDGAIIGVEVENLENYRDNLEQHYGSRDKAHNTISGLLGELEKRGDILYDQTIQIRYLRKVNNLIRDNATDAFYQITNYSGIQIAIEEFEILTQS